MPITPFLRDQAFDPETVEAMGEAFATTCEALGLSDHADAMTKVVAEKVIELARRGYRNPSVMHFAAIKEIQVRTTAPTPEMIPMGVSALYRNKGGEISRKHGDIETRA